MYQDISGPITEEAAEAETDQLFDAPDAPAAELPIDLLSRGYKLIIRAPDRMFAVSTQWGGTTTKTNIQDVIRDARAMVRFCEAVNRKKALGQ